MIAILLATYNGEKYLREQLDSLFSQTDTNFILYIRDDGSIDNTERVIQEYQKLYKNIIYIKDQDKHIGTMNNFMRLLKNADANYYMFCDQDDVWLPTKIEQTLMKMKEVELEIKDKPVVIFTDLVLVDSSLNTISNSMWDYCKINPTYTSDLYKYLVSSSITGCTLMINQATKDKSFPYPTSKGMLHDWWVGLVAVKHGRIEFIKESMVLYRQHENNEHGAVKVTRLYYLKKILNFKDAVLNYFEMDRILFRFNIKYNRFRRLFTKILIVINVK